jgi:hypothetical protein
MARAFQGIRAGEGASAAQIGRHVSLREFVDKRGVAWKAWDVVPGGMNPATAAELFVGEYQEGWLAFEAQNDLRRLPQWPADWAALPDTDLEHLCERAVPITRRVVKNAD